MSIAVTATLGVSGLYFGQSLRRRTRAEIEAQVAERRVQAYGELWQTTLAAAPSNGRAVTAAERILLHQQMTEWYFTKGNGMVLSEGTRAIYLTAKNNLECDVREVQPKTLRTALAAADAQQRDAMLGRAVVRQLSLLRTSMRADLLVYSGPWGRTLDAEDRRFLAACGISRWRRPWRPSLRHTPIAPVGRSDLNDDPPLLSADTTAGDAVRQAG